MPSLPTPLPLPAELIPILLQLPKSYLVGGCVRDHLLGLVPKDLDVEVYGMTYEELQKRLSAYGKVDLVGKSFGVVKLSLPGAKEPYDFSLARRDSKVENGSGHKAFTVETSAELTEKEGSARRDLTINSLMYDPRTGELLDFYNGIDDINNKVLRHTSPQFAEDPLRALRVVQFAARFDFDVAPETIELCKSISSEFKTLPKERVGEEFNKLLLKGKSRLRGLQVLSQMDWLKHFPELKALENLPQDPEWHPEGDALTHTGHVCDALARLPEWKALDTKDKLAYMYGALCHDLGKATTTSLEFKPKANRMAYVSPGHDKAGIAPTKSLLRSLNVPIEIARRVVPLVAYHMDHLQVTKDSQIRKLAVNMGYDNIRGLSLIVEADHSGRPPLKPEQPAAMQHILARATALNCDLHRPTPIVLGRHISEWTALEPSKAFGVLCDAAYEAQLDGKFSTEAEARAWMRLNRGKVLEGAKLAPERFLTGGDLVTAEFPVGPELGRLQRELFEQQLDGNIKSRKEAVEFVQTHQSVFKVPPQVITNLAGLEVDQVLRKATRTVAIKGAPITAPDPIAQEVLASKSLPEALKHFKETETKFSGKILGAGVGSVVLETIDRKAVRVGLGRVAQRENIPEMLQAQTHQAGNIRIEKTEIVQAATPEELEKLRLVLKSKGYKPSEELALDNIGRTAKGTVVVTDPGALEPISRSR